MIIFKRWLLASGYWQLAEPETRSQKPDTRGRQPEQSLTDSDNNSKLENWNFGFIFCFNDVNMLKGIRALPQLELWKME
jgi:hypothetical protein